MTEYFPVIPEFMESVSDWNRAYGNPLYELSLVLWYLLAVLTNLRILVLKYQANHRSHEQLLDTVRSWCPFGILQLTLMGGIYFLARWEIALTFYILGYLITGIALISQAREQNRAAAPR